MQSTTIPCGSRPSSYRAAMEARGGNGCPTTGEAGARSRPWRARARTVREASCRPAPCEAGGGDTSKRKRRTTSSKAVEPNSDPWSSTMRFGKRLCLSKRSRSVVWLRKHGLQGDHCRIIKVRGGRGESMEPTLADGAVILVNLESRAPKDGRIFIVRDDDLVARRRKTAGPRPRCRMAAIERQPEQERVAHPAIPRRCEGHRGGEVDLAELRIE